MLWAAQKAQWSLHCDMKYLGIQPSLDEFVARWQTVLEVWRAQKDMTVSRKDLSYLIEQLGNWFDNKMFLVRRVPTRVPTRVSPHEAQSCKC